MMDRSAANANGVDVMLLLEGTYPYVRGGVSNWIHKILSELTEFRFGLVFLGSHPEDYEGALYALPGNVAFLREYYLMDLALSRKSRGRRGNRDAFAAVERLHEAFKDSNAFSLEGSLTQAMQYLGRSGVIDQEDFLHSEAAWDQITRNFQTFCTDSSFIDYFWTVRNMHSPLFLLAQLARELPTARAVHSISTGYAGLLGSMLSRQRGIPFLVTEHGIYTKERKIDIYQAGWIQDTEGLVVRGLHENTSYIRRLWIRFFEQIGQVAYNTADTITTLYNGNRQRQIQEGAPPGKIRIIPNGIEVQRYEPALRARPDTVPPVMALVGRVVPIKDVKTFIRSMRTVLADLPQAEGWIVGPEEEDPDYTAECRALVDSLGLSDNIRFLGYRSVPDILPQIGLITLTSISEALPLVVLEAFAGGVPVISTDVGSCRELIEGAGERDRAIGMAGRVTPIADPEGTARAALDLLEDEAAWRRASLAALARVRRFYTQEQMFESYRQLYRNTMGI